jgi:hypothetical protein
MIVLERWPREVLANVVYNMFALVIINLNEYSDNEMSEDDR